jgi:hypothetical protein
MKESLSGTKPPNKPMLLTALHAAADWRLVGRIKASIT